MTQFTKKLSDLKVFVTSLYMAVVSVTVSGVIVSNAKMIVFAALFQNETGFNNFLATVAACSIGD